MKPSDLKKGHVVRYQGDLCKIVGIAHVQRGNWRSYYQIDMKSLKTGRVITNRVATHEDMDFVNVEARAMQYLYREGEHHVFMDNSTFEQVLISHDDIADQAPLIKDNADVRVNFVEGLPISLDLPTSVELAVVQTDPGVKGDTVSNVFKPAKLETGLEVKVPLYINTGDTVKIDTRTGEFLERGQQAK